MTGEGMLALWGALKSCLKPGDHVVSVGTGVFGDGIGEMAESFGCIVEKVSLPYDCSIRESDLRRRGGSHPPRQAGHADRRALRDPSGT